MRKIVLALLVSICAFQFIVAQNAEQEVLLTIDNQEITRAEFERIYTKNNQDPAFDQASLDEYMRLFINFKLKVIEAEALGMDTLESFVKELSGYRSQLEKPYFTDNSADSALIKEAYERMHFNIRASHILIKCDENALAIDTLKAYNKIDGIRKRALKGEDFNKLAKEFSDDPSAEKNGGDLGYFTAFSMVYEFESAAYNTPVGEISNIIRTRFGYHILKVVDKEKDKGRVQVAHIMRMVPNGSSVEKDKEEFDKIHAIYDSIQAGANFEEMVLLYSEDRGTSRKQGVLPFFSVGKMVPEFERAAFDLKQIGDISKPVKTDYGYHIIKLIATDPLGTLEVMEPIIKGKISKDVRAERGKQMVFERLKKEYKVVVNTKAITPFYAIVDSTLYFGAWDASKAEGLNQTLFTMVDTLIFTQKDFANYLSKSKSRRVKKPLEIIVNEEFSNYLEAAVIDFERSKLEEKYPEFKHLVKEYHDGILLFNLTDKLVWTKAITDTAGLEMFYNENKNNYMWGERLEATLYTFNKKEFEKKIVALAGKIGKKNLNETEERTKFMAKEAANDTTFTLDIVKNKFSKSDNDIIDAIAWTQGLKETQMRDSLYVVIFVNKLLSPEPKKLNEAKGLITADYQNYLEKIWLDELRTKYTVVINEEIFNSMIK
jgi:peptidyl-prolyl cis-trans isomerase SurA